MKGFIISVVIILFVVIGLVGITDPTIKVDHENAIAKRIENMGFSVIKRLDYDTSNIYIVYDMATNVEYIVEFGNGNVSFCPYYDSNGDVSIYSGWRND